VIHSRRVAYAVGVMIDRRQCITNGDSASSTDW
jgi:hypothetical protein